MDEDPRRMALAARALRDLGAASVLLKGGHGSAATLTDVLVEGDRTLELRAARIATRNTHGTGCTLSSAIAALLPQRPDIASAVADAHAYVAGAIRGSDRLSVGGGHGPLDHFFQPSPRRA